jgi:demethoxyubiquinone hydroxylase (CLK1/Coq7/Cat5 family)
MKPMQDGSTPSMRAMAATACDTGATAGTEDGSRLGAGLEACLAAEAVGLPGEDPGRCCRACGAGSPRPALVQALRSDHAGEAGAVGLYRGLLATSRDPGVRAFAQRHLATERHHLREIEDWLPVGWRTRLLPAWKAAGWLAGAVPGWLGPRAVYATIASVEAFVDRHYQAQIDLLRGLPEAAIPAGLLEVLEELVDDERDHRDEALARQTREPGLLLKLWCALVGAGSTMAVAMSRRI